MRTLGIDLAAQPGKTGVAWVEWTANCARVTDIRLGATDEELLEEMISATKTGIDCPFGWPRDFVAFVAKHQQDHVVVESGAAAEWRRRLSYRATDLHVKEVLPGVHVLSVSSDRIGVTTMRCVALLARLAAEGRPVARSGSGPVAEVYPAASLVRWGFNHKGYKGRHAQARREELVDAVRSVTPWLDLGPFEQLCRDSDDAFDALLASLTARAAALGQTELPPDAMREAAQFEGWIAVPVIGSALNDLVEQ